MDRPREKWEDKGKERDGQIDMVQIEGERERYGEMNRQTERKRWIYIEAER